MEAEISQEPHTQPERWPEKLLKKIPLECFRNPAPVVNILHLSGVISAGGGLRPHLNLQAIEEEIEAAFEGKHLKCVALQVNSPGGSPVQSQLIYNRIRALSQENHIPVVTFVEDVAASGGYWLACAGDEIFVSEASVIGSIGVIASGFGFVEAIKKIGIERRVYTQGENKSVLDPFKPEKETDIAIIHNVQRDIHTMFKALVKERRAHKIKPEDEEQLFSGEFWSGKQGLVLGLADAVGDLHQIMRERYGKKVKLNRISAKKNWLQRKFGFGAYSGTKAIADALLDSAQESALWNRFGLFK